MLKILDSKEDYLANTYYIDWKNKNILQKAKDLLVLGQDIKTIEKSYLFVRDEIKHSWDVQDRRVTVRASQVLQERVGICWAKANLLAALLRANNIPAGICYQRLTLGDTPDTGYCIHALNAVYVSSLKQWIRLDARGNKPGINAQMDLVQEKLAFGIRPEYQEIDYKDVYAEPLSLTMNILESSSDALEMYMHSLPQKL